MTLIQKFLVLVAISTLISSCGFYVTADEWVKCEKICEKNGGVDYYKNFREDVCFCINGIRIPMRNLNE